MTANEILRLMNRAPFERFDIYMNDGLRLNVEHPYQISTSPNSAVCTVYDMAGEMHIVSFRNITRVVTAAESSQSA
jgi:hypothetical protein